MRTKGGRYSRFCKDTDMLYRTFCTFIITNHNMETR